MFSHQLVEHIFITRNPYKGGKNLRPFLEDLEVAFLSTNGKRKKGMKNAFQCQRQVKEMCVTSYPEGVRQ